MKTTYHSNGKLLLTGEYVVLDGASALVLPTKYGQSLEVVPSKDEKIHWESRDKENNIWFKSAFHYDDNGNILLQHTDPTAETLYQILACAKQLNPDFLNEKQGWKVTTFLDFPRNWGLGTSSTLINNVAQWAKVNPYSLLNDSFGGSGFDIAAAQHNTPIRYRIKEGKPVVEEIVLPWTFKDALFFVHLNKKQDSRAGILEYRKTAVDSDIFACIDTINQDLLGCTSIIEFEELMEKHEKIIAKTTQTPTVKSRLFPDYPRCIKSLGAWGGDFVLATGGTSEKEYFKSKGYFTLIDFIDMVK